MQRILLHTCCGPCTIYPLEWLRREGWVAHGFFYNPNIHPYQELERRLQSLQTLAEQKNLPLIVRPEYELDLFLRQVVFREENRCVVCYALRLHATARLARKSGFDAFTSSLLYSKQQKHDLIRSIAEDAARKHNISFLYQDFRVGWSEGREAAEAMGLYRQQYCGCIYSERDRYYRRRAEPDAPQEEEDPKRSAEGPSA